MRSLNNTDLSPDWVLIPGATWPVSVPTSLAPPPGGHSTVSIRSVVSTISHLTPNASHLTPHLIPDCVLQDLGKDLSPSWAPATLVQCVAAVMSGCTTSLLTNPLDLVRTRVQVTSLTTPGSDSALTSLLYSGTQVDHPRHYPRSLGVGENENFPERSHSQDDQLQYLQSGGHIRLRERQEVECSATVQAPSCLVA